MHVARHAENPRSPRHCALAHGHSRATSRRFCGNVKRKSEQDVRLNVQRRRTKSTTTRSGGHHRRRFGASAPTPGGSVRQGDARAASAEQRDAGAFERCADFCGVLRPVVVVAEYGEGAEASPRHALEPVREQRQAFRLGDGVARQENEIGSELVHDGMNACGVSGIGGVRDVEIRERDDAQACGAPPKFCDSAQEAADGDP